MSLTSSQLILENLEFVEYYESTLQYVALLSTIYESLTPKGREDLDKLSKWLEKNSEQYLNIVQV